MSQKALSMRKIKEVLRLRYDLGLLQNEIARSCSIAQSSVHRYLERATAAGLSWPLPQDCDDRRLNELLFPAAPAGCSPPVRGPVDFAAIHRELQSNKHVTLQLLWEEYRQSQPEGYRYSRFCELYRRWHRKLDVVLRQDHRAGEKMFVDWAGTTIPIYDRETGAAQPASLFVAVLGASSYAFARATLSQDLSNWIECHVLAFEFFQGTSKLIVPDNPRTGVTRACRYEPDLNRTYLEMAKFYGVAIMPARPYKARDVVAVQLPSQEGRDVVGLDGVDGGSCQVGIEGLKIDLPVENDVGGVFGLIQAPVVLHAKVTKNGAKPLSKLVQFPVDPLDVPIVGNPLRFVPIPNFYEGIVQQLVSDFALPQLSR